MIASGSSTRSISSTIETLRSMISRVAPSLGSSLSAMLRAFSCGEFTTRPAPRITLRSTRDSLRMAPRSLGVNCVGRLHAICDHNVQRLTKEQR